MINLNKTFKKPNNLSRHMRKHTREIPFQCSKCEMSFAQQYKLTSHITTHSGEKPFKCNKCDKAFTWSNDLSHFFSAANVRCFLPNILIWQFIWIYILQRNHLNAINVIRLSHILLVYHAIWIHTLEINHIDTDKPCVDKLWR